MRKLAGDIITLHRCTKNQDHMMYASWDMECDGHNFVIQGHFLPFNPLITQKIKFLEKCPGISSFYSCVPKMTIIWCMVPEIWSVTIFFVIICGAFFRFTLTAQLIKILEKWKKKTPGDIIILHMCTINDNHKMYGYWDMECDT